MDNDGRLYSIGALVPAQIKQAIALRAKATGVSKSDIIRFALVSFLNNDLVEINKEESK